MASGSPLKKFMSENTAGMKILGQVFGSDFSDFTKDGEKPVKKNLNKPERRQFRKEVALAADIFMRLTLHQILSMMGAVA